jgi:Protein of unknown function (DUF1501)
MTTRRRFLKVLSGGALAALTELPLTALAQAATKENDGEFFVFIHASGGWDVTLWSDPRNEAKGIVMPASTDNTDKGQVRLWVDAPLDGATKTFELVRPKNSNLVLGPGIGTLAEMPDRITVVNGLAMNTVAHPDGSTYSATGRHPQGGRVAASSIDTMLSNELGKEQLLPTVSLRFPSAFVGDNLAVDDVSSVGRTLFRAQMFDTNAERDKVTALLSEEASDLAKRSTYPGVLEGMDLQYQSLRRMLGTNLQEVFTANSLKTLHPQFNYKARFGAGPSVNASFAVEAMKRNIVRCVSFTFGSFDTHGNNYKTHAQNQQELFDMVATLLKTLDGTPHPTKTGKKLSDHVHILVVSEFCRTPQINLAMGRDHYPNNSALVVSPRFRTNFSFGKTDAEQLLPMAAKSFTDGNRAIAPPDLLATFLGAFAIDPRKYMRDGEVVKELLKA